MQKFFKGHYIAFSVMLFSIIIGFIFSMATTKIYLSKSHVGLFRQNLEDPDGNNEEARNRWVWIRDGLNLQSALVTDAILVDFISKNTAAKEYQEQFPGKNLSVAYLKSLIKIDYTGADENNYIIEVKAPTPKLAYELNDLIFDRLKYLAIESNRINFEAVMAKLNAAAEKVKDNSDSYHFYQNKIEKMVFNFTVNQTQRERGFSVVTNPSLPTEPIWPKTGLILLVTAVVGLIIGCFIEFLLFYFKKK
ncbi:MAG: hypothetical protein U0T83_10005 [Bacteriovoracaceae bacterium]